MVAAVQRCLHLSSPEILVGLAAAQVDQVLAVLRLKVLLRDGLNTEILEAAGPKLVAVMAEVVLVA